MLKRPYSLMSAQQSLTMEINVNASLASSNDGDQRPCSSSFWTSIILSVMHLIWNEKGISWNENVQRTSVFHTVSDEQLISPETVQSSAIFRHICKVRGQEILSSYFHNDLCDQNAIVRTVQFLKDMQEIFLVLQYFQDNFTFVSHYIYSYCFF